MGTDTFVISIHDSRVWPYLMIATNTVPPTALPRVVNKRNLPDFLVEDIGGGLFGSRGGLGGGELRGCMDHKTRFPSAFNKIAATVLQPECSRRNWRSSKMVRRREVRTLFPGRWLESQWRFFPFCISLIGR